MAISIKRTLVHFDRGGRRHEIRQDDIASFRQPVVILGDPGMGKSVLASRLGECPGMTCVRAGTFVRCADPASLVTRGERIVIDGLDEIASSAPGGAVHAVLSQLSAMHHPPFIVTCREADWRGGADRVGIEEDYGHDALLLHLLPFSREDARGFLSHQFPEVDADRVLDHVANCGLEDIYKNPLTLRMLGETAREAGALPDGRGKLFERACGLMLSEKNEHHRDGPHAHRSEDELLLAAGAICATLLLCDREAVYVGPHAETPDGFVNVTDIGKLRLGEATRDALKVRLFQGDGEQRFTHIHRVIAEYLGARWLARCFEERVSKRRLFSLFRHGDGVPTSLRGLHAWIAHFSEALAGRCIAADPYAVLRYGDAETLSLDEARALLDALQELSEEDPYFRSEDWGRHRVSGLMRPELKRNIVGIIGTPGKHVQLRTLLLEAMAGTALATELTESLDEIMFDPDRHHGERAAAAEAMHSTSDREGWEAIVGRLLKLGDAASARLACELIDDVGARAVSIPTCVEAVFAHLGLSVSRLPQTDEETLRSLRSSLFSDLDAGQLSLLLDEIADSVRMLTRVSERAAKSELARLVRRIAADVLEAEPAIEAQRVWRWIGWLGRGMRRGDGGRERLAGVFRTNGPLRAALLEHVLLASTAKNWFAVGHELIGLGLDLYPTEEDLVGLLRTLRARAGDGQIDPDAWRGLLNLGRTGDGIPVAVRDAAREAAGEDPELLAVLADAEEVVEAPWQKEEAEREARAEEERNERFESHRAMLIERLDDVAAGDYPVLVQSARVYMGDYIDFDEEAAPASRLREFLGDELCDRVLDGFVAVLGRDDLPGSAEIVNVRFDGKWWLAELPMICGIAETIRRGMPLAQVDRETLKAAYMAWQRSPSSCLAETVDMDGAMEAVLFETEADKEAHFRASIEPQLARNTEHPVELHRLVNEPRFVDVSGLLCIEWLEAFPILPPRTQRDLLVCALKNGSREAVKGMLARRKRSDDSDDETRRLWLSADFLLDFENCRGALHAAAAEDPALLWALRDRVAPERGERAAHLALSQQVFFVEAFGMRWGEVEWPRGLVMGSENAWDASELIRNTIYAIGQDPSPDATEVLVRLIEEDHAPSHGNTLRHALALQRKARRDREYTAPTVGQLEAVISDRLPETIDDMRAFFGDRMEALRERMQGSNTDMWQAYWSEEGPRDEPYCRNRLIEHISGQLPASIRFEPEMHMPEQKRADIAAIRNTIGLPVEIKGQWHTDVWDAACEQLDAKYTRDWHAEGRGAYIVFWFGDVSGKNLPGHPDGLPRPNTPDELSEMLIDRIPETRRSDIDVFVIDVSRPNMHD